MVGRESGSVRAVDGDLVVVGSESMTVSVRVVDKSSLEHLVVGGFDSGDQVAGGEGTLLGLSMEVLGVAVKMDLSNGMERVVAMGPDLGDIVGVESVGLGILDGHELDEPVPGGDTTTFDVVEEVVRGVILVFDTLSRGLCCGKVLDTRGGLEVILDESLFSL